MKALILLSLLIASLSSFAQRDCAEDLYQGFSKDSVSFQFYDSDIAELYEEKAELAAEAAFNRLKAEYNCEEPLVEAQNIVCKEIIPGNSFSKSCYGESDLGYFFISVDMLENVNIVLNRWD